MSITDLLGGIKALDNHEADQFPMPAVLAHYKRAEGVVLGSRFVSSKESPIHRNMKELLLKSQKTDTVATQRSLRNVTQGVKNGYALKVLGFETSFPTLQQPTPLNSGAANDE